MSHETARPVRIFPFGTSHFVSLGPIKLKMTTVRFLAVPFRAFEPLPSNEWTFSKSFVCFRFRCGCRRARDLRSRSFDHASCSLSSNCEPLPSNEMLVPLRVFFEISDERRASVILQGQVNLFTPRGYSDKWKASKSHHRYPKQCECHSYRYVTAKLLGFVWEKRSQKELKKPRF